MQILVNTDHNIEGSEKYARYVETQIRAALHRFAELITRVDVHLSDENGAKSGGADKKCLIEACPAGHQPLAASGEGATLQAALDSAVKKMVHLLESTIGRAHHHKGEASIRNENPTK